MTGRLADIGDRIEGIRQLGAVVNAMRGIAAARAQQARTQRAAVDLYAATIAAAIGRVLATADPADPAPRRRTGRLALVLFCAEQGFAGAFSERVLEQVGPDLATSDLFLIGTRGMAALSARGIATDWASPMPSHSPGVPKLAERILAALEAKLGDGRIDRLDTIFSRWQPDHGVRVERRRLLPFDRTLVPSPADGDRPLLNLAPPVLVAALGTDYMHAQFCQAALHAFAAENEARMIAMAAARTQIERTLSGLQATQRQVRQEEITAEIIELAAGEAASRPD